MGHGPLIVKSSLIVKFSAYRFLSVMRIMDGKYQSGLKNYLLVRSWLGSNLAWNSVCRLSWLSTQGNTKLLSMCWEHIQRCCEYGLVIDARNLGWMKRIGMNVDFLCLWCWTMDCIWNGIADAVPINEQNICLEKHHVPSRFCFPIKLDPVERVSAFWCWCL